MGDTPYSPDMAAADFYLFPRLKLTLTGQRFCDTTDIIKNATEELKRLSQSSFLYIRWKKCTVAQGDYFEGNIA